MKKKRENSFLCLTAAVMVVLFGVSFLTCVGAGKVWADEPCNVSSIASAETPTDGDGGCAAAYLLGEDDPRLDTLRQFRDGVLAKSTIGNKLIEVYYSNSEAAIALLEKDPKMKKSATVVLESLVSLNISSNASAETPTDGDGGCAAAYVLGEDDPRLDTLRQFRDEVLAKSTVGSKLIELYYNTSEAVIAILDKNPRIRKALAATLKFLVRK
jgi:thiamine phosphate synthase YjbQ (UPF0047 family)